MDERAGARLAEEAHSDIYGARTIAKVVKTIPLDARPQLC
jgi:hypothetical protein